MSQSVARKTSISEKTWRRQTDSPSGWIAFSCGSVILHLLAFWLIGSYKLSSSQQQRSQSALPIEFIEISPQKSLPVQPSPKPKPVLPKPAKPIVPQNLQPAIPKTVKPPVTTNDQNAIAFDNQKLERQQQQQQKLAQQQRQLEAEQLKKEAQQQREEQQTQRKLERQQQREEQQNQQKLERQQQLEEQQNQQKLERQQQLEEQQNQQKLERQQQREEQQNQRKLERQQQLEEQQNQRKLERQQQREDEQQQNPEDGVKIADAPADARGLTPPEQLAKTPQAPIQNQPTQSGGILTASWKIDTNTFFKDKPDNLAQPLKRSNSDIPLPAPEDGNFQPRDFLVWLTIDNQGNASVTKIETPDVAQKEQYRKYAEEIFNNQKFIPATENNGNKPDFSNLPVRVNIQEGSN